MNLLFLKGGLVLQEVSPLVSHLFEVQEITVLGLLNIGSAQQWYLSCHGAE